MTIAGPYSSLSATTTVSVKSSDTPIWRTPDIPPGPVGGRRPRGGPFCAHERPSSSAAGRCASSVLRSRARRLTFSIPPNVAKAWARSTELGLRLCRLMGSGFSAYPIVIWTPQGTDLRIHFQHPSSSTQSGRRGLFAHSGCGYIFLFRLRFRL
eukprot:COSAG02_NODE_850_length_16538_cov_55.923231_5_plen_154_part_00